MNRRRHQLDPARRRSQPSADRDGFKGRRLFASVGKAKFGPAHVVDALTAHAFERGMPDAIISDNNPFMSSRTGTDWNLDCRN